MEKVRRILKWLREKMKHARAWAAWRPGFCCRRSYGNAMELPARPRESRRGEQVFPSLLPLAAVARHDTENSSISEKNILEHMSKKNIYTHIVTVS
ncbi:uncharacterized protein [Lolium perenne]|uniref:uncharacterized protein isoform X4 n=1 Tax=Lolium perenne TaxID=4522 RepID=UPI0021F505BD|nr:uncharacterized protein LOC127301475 isoform X4 [Lolium perenne]